MRMLFGITAAIMKNRNSKKKIRIEAARIATGATKLISINNLYNEIVGKLSKKRRVNHKLVLFYKMYNNLTPGYLSSLIPSFNFYRDHRIELFQIVSQYCNASLHVFLHGDGSLPYETNQGIFKLLQVQDSKRF